MPSNEINKWFETQLTLPSPYPANTHMHLLSIDENIKVNTVVTDQTVIAKVGGGSTAKSKGGYDTCTTGTHLHFGIADGWNATSFNSYSFNPREKLVFPKLVYSGGGYFYR